jgi:hypothetical protein
MDDLRAFDEELADDLISNPGDFIAWVCLIHIIFIIIIIANCIELANYFLFNKWSSI